MKRLFLLLFGLTLFVSCSSKDEPKVGITKLSTNLIEMPNSEATKNISFVTDCGWAINCDANWLDISSKSGVAGNQLIRVTAEENKDVKERSAIIHIVSENIASNCQVEVIQKAGKAFITPLNMDLQINADGESMVIPVEANVSFVAKSNAEWCEVSAADSYSNGKNLSIVVAPNNLPESRNTKIILENSEHKISVSINVEQKASEAYIKPEKNEIEVSAEKSVIDIEIDANVDYNYTISSYQSWCKVAKSSGGVGKSTLSIEVDDNAISVSRRATVTLYNETYAVSGAIVITQLGAEAYISLPEESITMPANAESKRLTFDSNISYIITSNADWCSVKYYIFDGTKTHDMIISVTANDTTSSRTATITVSNANYNVTRTLIVVQEALAPSLNLSDSRFDVSSVANKLTTTIDSNIDYTITSSASWCTVSDGSGTSGKKTLTINVAANDTTSSRTATITVRNANYNITRTLVVTQAAFVPSLNLSQTSFSASSEAGQFSVTINSNIDYTISSNVSWCTVSAKTGAAGSKNISLSVATNVYTSNRIATITVSNSKYGISKYIQISQLAFNPEIVANVVSYSTSAKGAVKSVTIRSNVSWTASNSASWIKISKSSGGVGETTMEITLDDNLTSSYRTSSVVLVNSQYGISRKIEISQMRCYTMTYTSSNSQIVTPYSASALGANILANTYLNSKGTIYLDTQITEIGEKAFYGKKDLISITFPSSVTSVGKQAFYNCTALKEINFSANLKTVNDEAFYGCDALKTVVLPDGVTHVKYRAFGGCEVLGSITFGSGIQNIDYPLSGSNYIGRVYIKNITPPSGDLGITLKLDPENLWSPNFLILVPWGYEDVYMRWWPRLAPWIGQHVFD